MTNHILLHNQDTPEHQSGGEEDPQCTPPSPSPTIQIWFCLLSKYLSLSMILNLVLFPFGLSGAAFTSNSQETQGGLSIDTGTISELVREHILYISDNHPSACRPCTIWITWPTKYCNPELSIATPHSCWLQSRRNTPEAGKQPFSLLADPITLLFPSAILTLSSFQAQESPDNSLFSFQIGATSQEEGEETSSADSAVLSNEIKARLQESLQFLNQDIGQLIKNAQPICAILEELEGKLPEAIEVALTPAAFIESHRAQFNKA